MICSGISSELNINDFTLILKKKGGFDARQGSGQSERLGIERRDYTESGNRR